MMLSAAVLCSGCRAVGPSEGCQSSSEACGFMWRTLPIVPTTLCASGHGMPVELKVKSGSPETTLERERKLEQSSAAVMICQRGLIEKEQRGNVCFCLPQPIVLYVQPTVYAVSGLSLPQSVSE